MLIFVTVARKKKFMKNEFTIFYTDDDLDDLDFFSEVVDSMNTDVTLVTQNNGRKLLDALNNPPPSPSIIFLDLNMPGINGFDVLTEIRSTENLKNLTVVILSTSNDDKIIDKSLNLGANFYITKPNDFVSLKKSIEHSINVNWNLFTPNKDNFVYLNN